MVAPNTLLQNRYLIQKQIGQGGMGAVFIATDERFGSTVALKETFFDDPSLRKAFEREARLLNHLRHAALPKVIDHFTEAEGQFLVMEYIAGDDLAEKLKARGGAFPLSEVLNWADQLLDALDYLHTQEPPVIHRDIKPQNLKLTPRNHIVLLDFGLAKGTPSQLSKVTATGSIFGYSRNYAPLEQIQGAGTDPRSDLYSLGATLYHLMTGFTPPDALTRATSVLNGQPDPLQSAEEVHVQVPPGVAAVLSTAMAQNASQRPENAAQMREALRSAAQQSHIAATHVSTKDSLFSTSPTLNVYEQETQLIYADAKPTSDKESAEKTTPIEKAAADKTTPNEKAGRATVAEAATPASIVAGSKTKTEDGGSVITKIASPEASGWMQGRKRSIAIAASLLVVLALAAGVYTFTRNPSSNESAQPTPTATETPGLENQNPITTAEPTPQVEDSPTAQPTAQRTPRAIAESTPEPETAETDPTPPPRLPPPPDGRRPPPGSEPPPRPGDPDYDEAMRTAEDRRQAAIEERRAIQERRRIMILRQMERDRRRRQRYP